VWDSNGYVMERTVDVHITHLRRKLGQYGKHIITKSGYGYMFSV
jgi:two-component system alkaline phosphatase synthesis response regulator PhoP